MAVTINGSAGVTTNSGAVYNGISSGTAVTASGTSIDFTSIPSWVKRITVMFNGVSISSTANIIVQLGSGSFTTSGYATTGATMGAVNTVSGIGSITSGLFTGAGSGATNTFSGSMIITNITSNTWVSCSLGGFINTNYAAIAGGNISLSGTLDRLRITTTSTDTFDAGSINILYE